MSMKLQAPNGGNGSSVTVGGDSTYVESPADVDEGSELAQVLADVGWTPVKAPKAAKS